MPFVPTSQDEIHLEFLPLPAAGTDFVFTIPAGEAWDIRAISFLFTAANAVGNRIISFQLLNPTPTIILQTPPVFTAIINDIIQFSLCPFFPLFASAPPSPYIVTCPFQPTLLLENETFQTVTAGINGADTYTNILIAYRLHRI
jgi:hypothetical protein